MQSTYYSPVVIGNASPVIEARPISPDHWLNPYRPDSVIDAWGTDLFIIRAASIRGRLHRYLGVPRQDDFALSYHAPSGRLVVAVADGLSSAPHSHIGATIAVRHAVQWITERLSDDSEAGPIDWMELFRHTAWQIIEQGNRMLGIEPVPVPAEAAEAVLATTLVCALIEFPLEKRVSIIHAASIGDSGIWTLDGGTFSRRAGGKDDSGQLASSEVLALPRVPRAIDSTLAETPGESVILIGTDGFGDPLGTGTGSVGQFFADNLVSPPSMLAFAHLLDFSRETFDDDRTLVAVWRLDAEAV